MDTSTAPFGAGAAAQPHWQLQQEYRRARQTLIGRFLLLLAGWLICGFMFYGTITDLVFYARLRLNGAAISTSDFSFNFEPQKSATSPHYALRYRFSPPGSGETIEAGQDITTSAAILFLREAQAIPITYLPGDPTRAAFIDKYELPGLRFWAIIGLLVVAAPLEIVYHAWGMRKARRALRASLTSLA